ncbi:MAG: TetR family transcriptional regulator [Solirubrobacteraceae bacterium]|nr:TetR family transcriptional regulator [Solirubrobacteraceae bacterium]
MPAVAPQRRALRRRHDEARALIVEAAEQTLREHPFREVSVDEVMQAAGLSRTVFYRHFDDLSDLVLRVASSAFEELFAAHERVVDAAAITRESLVAAIEPAIDVFVRHGPLVRAISEAASYDGDVERVFLAAQERAVAVTGRLFERARDAGAPITDAAETARALTAMNVRYLIDAYGGRPRVEPVTALATLLEVWLGVLGPSVGRG